MVQPDYGMEWCGMVWYRMVWYRMGCRAAQRRAGAQAGKGRCLTYILIHTHIHTNIEYMPTSADRYAYSIYPTS